MFKENRNTIILTSVMTVLPVVIGIVLWKQLPQVMPVHFNFQGQPDNWMPKAFVVFGLPFLCLGLEWLCLWGTLADPKRANISKKVFTLVLWIVPLVSWLCSALSYLYALGLHVDVRSWAEFFIGFIGLIIGNYLPKCRQTYTVGIKLPWTLASSENWNHTHRMAGPLYIAGGLFFMADAFFPFAPSWLFVVVLLALILIPVFYSYWYYRVHDEHADAR